MKIRFPTYLWAIFGIFVSLLALGVLFLFIPLIEAGGGATKEADLFGNWNGLLALMTALAFACFSIFSAAIAAKVIVNEYCGKNASVLFSYPIDRKVLLGAKCRIVSGITTASAFISNVSVVGIMYILAHIFHVIPQMDAEHYFLTVLLSSLFMGVLASAVGVIAAAFGWKKRSVIATIVCALLIVCALTNCITILPNHMIGVMTAMCLILGITAGFVYRFLGNGIEKMEV